MNFLDDIFARLESAGDTVLLQEMRDGRTVSASGRELLRQIGQARAFLASKGLKKGDRCALLAHNSIRWVAMNMAIIAEGMTAVPLYGRQAPAELVTMMKDCSPSLICCGDQALRAGIVESWPETPPQFLFDDIFSAEAGVASKPQLADSDPVTIIYTSGTSGDAKGVVLTAGNVGFILGATSARLDILMSRKSSAKQDRVYQYLPFCFGASWIALLTYLLRGSLVTLNTDLTKLAGEIRGVAPDYFLNVPALLERMRKAVDEQLWKTGGMVLAIYTRAKNAWMRQQEGKSSFSDSVWLSLAKALVFPAIRRKMIGAHLKALISGSAPLNMETQLYFLMLGIPVLQVYGLTETTGICTMDDPCRVVPGRVGPAVEGIEMKLGENDEIIVRGPNVFPGYWNRALETDQALRGGWFHTGDQGEVDAAGNWRITGRVKNLIILGSGHKVTPEAIEEELLRHLPAGSQVVLAGNGKGYLSAIITGAVSSEQAQATLDAVNPGLPHYKQIRAFHICAEVFSVDNGLLTVNGKMKRDAIAARLRGEIEAIYAVKQAG
jgi:long-chain acyl-CoA synthetase